MMHNAIKLKEPSFQKLLFADFYRNTLYKAYDTVKPLALLDSHTHIANTLHSSFNCMSDFYAQAQAGLEEIKARVRKKETHPYLQQAFQFYTGNICSTGTFTPNGIQVFIQHAESNAKFYKNLAYRAQLAKDNRREHYAEFDFIFGEFLFLFNELNCRDEQQRKAGNNEPYSQQFIALREFYVKILDVLELQLTAESTFIRPFIKFDARPEINILFVDTCEIKNLLATPQALIESLKDEMEYFYDKDLSPLTDAEYSYLEKACALAEEFELCQASVNTFSTTLLQNAFAFHERTTHVKKIKDIIELGSQIAKEATACLFQTSKMKELYRLEPYAQETEATSPALESDLASKFVPEIEFVPVTKSLNIGDLGAQLGAMLTHPQEEIAPVVITKAKDSSSSWIIFEYENQQKARTILVPDSKPINPHPWADKLQNHQDTIEAIFSTGIIHARALAQLIEALGGTVVPGAKGAKLHIPLKPFQSDPSKKSTFKNGWHLFHGKKKGNAVPERLVSCIKALLVECKLSPAELWPVAAPISDAPLDVQKKYLKFNKKKNNKKRNKR